MRILWGFLSCVSGWIGLLCFLLGLVKLFWPDKIHPRNVEELLLRASGRISLNLGTVALELVAGAWLVAVAIRLGFWAWG